jgi:hypothetical protein
MGLLEKQSKAHLPFHLLMFARATSLKVAKARRQHCRNGGALNPDTKQGAKPSRLSGTFAEGTVAAYKGRATDNL